MRKIENYNRLDNALSSYIDPAPTISYTAEHLTGNYENTHGI